jgi:hypothetical protein
MNYTRTTRTSREVYRVDWSMMAVSESHAHHTHAHGVLRMFEAHRLNYARMTCGSRPGSLMNLHA